MFVFYHASRFCVRGNIRGCLQTPQEVIRRLKSLITKDSEVSIKATFFSDAHISRLQPDRPFHNFFVGISIISGWNRFEAALSLYLEAHFLGQYIKP